MSALSDFASTGTRWRSWLLMANQDISLRYKRSVLGPFWISIAMGVTALGVGFLYAEVFQRPMSEYIPYLAVGFMTWNYLAGMIKDGDSIVIESAGHLRSVRIPVPVLAARMVFRNFIILLHNVLVVLLIAVLFGRTLNLWSLMAIPGIFTVGLVGYFCAIILGPIGARYRDVPQTTASTLQLAFLLTPIFWQPHQVMDRSYIVDFNPFYHLVEIIREPMLGGQASAMNWIVSGGVLLALAIGAAASLPKTRGRVSLWI